MTFQVNSNTKAIICDIEGTTTSISFVKDVLFPYVRNSLKSYLTDNYESSECRQDIQLLIQQAKEDQKTFGDQVPIIVEDFTNKEELIASVVKNVTWLMDADRKILPLKQLQGHMWRRAYEDGSIKGHVYDDVVPAFENWISKGLKVYIYSSGSVEAQKLLFGFSVKGDLLKYFSGHFDTNIGMKVEAQSYKKISESIDVSPENCLFLTDLIKEAEAATEAGMDVCVLRREDNPDKEKKSFKWVASFDQIDF